MCLRLVRCLGCDLVYAPIPPSVESLRDAYAGAGFDSAMAAGAAARTYAAALEKYVDRLSGRKAAVDVGAGDGALLPWLRDRGFSPVIGIEPSYAAIEAASRDARPMLRHGMFAPDMLDGATPSLICSFMALEHLAAPGDFVRMAWQLLEPGGMLALVVHNWRAPLNRLLGRHSPIIDIEHLQLFSPKSLGMLLANAGFESIEQADLRNTYPLSYWLRLTPLPGRIKRGMTAALARLELADKPVSMRVGNLLAVGYKPMERVA